MQNKIKESPAQLIPQVTLVIPGITSYGALLGFAPTMEATLTTKKAALVLADSNYEQARIDLRTARNAKQLAIRNARNHLRTVRELMRPFLSPLYSQLWNSLGFDGGLALPKSVSGMIMALIKMGNHLTENPALGVADANLVAAKTIAIEAALSTATTTLNQKKADVQRFLEDRAAAALEVRLLLREVLGVLRVKLSPLDARWTEFGFNKPGAQSIPDAPTNVAATMINATTMSVKWPSVPRAQHYRVWKRVIGVDPELVFAGNTSELDFLIQPVPGNALVEVALSAVNNGGESGKSTVVVVQTA